MTNPCVYTVHAHIHVNMHTHVKLGFVALLSIIYILYVLESMEKLVHDPTTQQQNSYGADIFLFFGQNLQCGDCL